MPKAIEDITNEHINELIEKLQAVLADEHAPVGAYCLLFLQGYMHGALEAQGNTDAIRAVVLSARQGVEFGRECALREAGGPVVMTAPGPEAGATEADTPTQNAPTSQTRH